MSDELPPDSFEEMRPELRVELGYQTPDRRGNAPTLIRLAGIFNVISAVLDGVYVLGMAAMCVFSFYMTTILPTPRAGAAAAPMPVSVQYMMLAVYGGCGLLSLLVAVPKLIGGIKLLRDGKHAWGWGLAAGICGSVQVWTFEPCCVPLILFMGAGIFTVVVMSLPNVRAYFSSPGPVG